LTPKHQSIEQGFIFISDVKLNKEIKKSFKTFNKNIIEYNYNTFHNLRINDIGLKYIWFNITEANCKLYVQKNIKQGTNYKKYIITSDLEANWIKDIELYIDKKMKMNKLKNHLMALSYEDFTKNINSVPISDVPNKLISVFGYIQDHKIKKKVLKIIKSILTEDIPFHLIMLALSSSVPCLVGAVEIVQKIKESNDIKNIILKAIDDE
jgi:hypothetical protein